MTVEARVLTSPQIPAVMENIHGPPFQLPLKNSTSGTYSLSVQIRLTQMEAGEIPKDGDLICPLIFIKPLRFTPQLCVTYMALGEVLLLSGLRRLTCQIRILVAPTHVWD